MAELSELVPGSRWLDNDGDLVVVLRKTADEIQVAWYKPVADSWEFSSYEPAHDSNALAKWAPYVAKCPDFERYFGLDEDVDPEVYGDIDTRLTGLIYDAFVFRIGVKDGEPFIEQVKP